MNPYEMYGNDRLTDRASGGVPILVASKHINHQLTVCSNSENLEFISISFGSSNVNIYSAYMVPNKKNLQNIIQ